MITAIVRSLTLATAILVSACAADAPPAAGKDAAKPYPLDTCIVSGEKLGGAMGDPVTVVKDGQEFKLCCKDCVKDLDKDPKKYADKLAAARKKTDEPKQPAAPVDDHAGHDHAK
jgi:hypothetical protein